MTQMRSLTKTMQRLNFQEETGDENLMSLSGGNLLQPPLDPATQGLAYAPGRENCVAEKLGKMNQ